MIKEHVPRWIAWEVTRRCNFDCVHCRSSSSLDAFDSAFTTEGAKALIDELAAFATPVLVLSGGEPLLRDDLFEIAAHGTDRGLRMCVATNGSLVTDEVCEEMLAAQIRMVSLSLDGADAETHDAFRNQAGAFESVLRAAERLRAHGVEFLINSSFTKRNQGQIGDVMRLAKRLGAKAWYMFMIVPTGRGEGIMDELISKEDYEEILRWHYEAEQAEDELLMRPTCAPHYYRIVAQLNRERAADERLARRSLKFSTGGSKGCLAAQLICMITAEGEVYPCSYFPRSAGNVLRTPFAEIWNDAPLFQELRDLDRYRGKCGSCEFLRVCGGCRARADAVHGDHLGEEPFCSYVPVELREPAEE